MSSPLTRPCPAERSSSTVALSDPDAAFSALCEDMAEHGLTPERPSAGCARVEVDSMTLQLQTSANHLVIDVTAPGASGLFFLKEAVTQHILRIDAAAGAAMTWSDGGAADRPPNFQEGRVEGVDHLGDDLLRLDLSVADAGAFARDGLHVKAMIPARHDRPPVWPRVAANGTTIWPKGADELHVRYYTLRRVDVEAGRVWIDVVLHPGGRIAGWCETARPGARIGLMGPGGGALPAGDGPALIVGDRTALPAIARLLEDMPDAPRATVVVPRIRLRDGGAYLPDSTHDLVELDPTIFTDPSALSEAVGDAARLAGGPARAWFGGEFDAAQAMRRLFRQELGLSKGTQMSVAYWRRGRVTDASAADEH